MNEEKKIAQAIMDAQKMREESYDEENEDYIFTIDQCLVVTCIRYELSINMPVLLSLAMHWWNDIQAWADDVMADKNILRDCCNLPPQPDDVIEITDKGREAVGKLINLCDTCIACLENCNGDPEFGDSPDHNDNVINCDTYMEA